MQFDGALITEQGITFAIIVVRPYILSSPQESAKARTAFGRYFPGVPIVLMAQDSRGTPTYSGRKDIVEFLAHIHPSRIPWNTYTVN